MSFNCVFTAYFAAVTSLKHFLFMDYSKLHDVSVCLMKRSVKYLNHRPVFNNVVVSPKIAV